MRLFLFELLLCTEAGLVSLNAEQFETEVLKSDRGALVKFYAPWCGYCKKMAPVYEELADSFSEEDGVLIAQVDFTAHPVKFQGGEIEGYPKVYYFEKDVGEEFKGVTECLECMQEYVTKKSGLYPSVGEDDL